MLINENLKKIFGAKYYQKVVNYIDVIQNVINSYDVVVFMARKAYCFFLALKSNDLLQIRDDCVILSSRAITYNGFDFCDKKVAIIEDVVILGESLFDTIEEERFRNISLDVYMLACSQEFSSQTSEKKTNIIFNSSLILKENELLELATLITNYIIYEMIPYNADYPSFSFYFSNREELGKSLNKNNFCSITELVHCKNKSITEGVIPIGDEIFANVLPQNLIDNSIFKIRVYIDERKKVCHLVPIVIFSKIESQQLEGVFESLFTNKYNSIVQYGDEEKTLKNKLRILSYKLAEGILYSHVNDLINTYSIEKTSSEKELFTIDLLYDYPHNHSSKSCDHLMMNGVALYNSLGYAYDLLINSLDVDSKNSSKFKREYISFGDIKEKVSIVESNTAKAKLISSLILDVFIDNGVIVPRTKFDSNLILRIFKFGEVAKLTAHDIKLFALVLQEYSDLIKRTLDKTEIEKISVIFFRNFNNNFNVEDNEAEAYRICYSKFGPRISSSDVQYRVAQGQAFIDVLASEDLVTPVGDRYNINPIHQEERDNKVNDWQRTLIAGKLQKLNEFFVSAQKRNPDNELFNYINSYVRLLTLLAIGSDKQDKLLSLIAEVDLIRSKKLANRKNLSLIIAAFNGIIDGILSGAWKYCCYKKENLVNNTLRLMCTSSGEANAMYATDIFWQSEKLEEQKNIEEFLDEIGLFLGDIVAFNYYLCKYTKSKVHDDYSKPPYKNILKMTPFVVSFKKYQKLFSDNNDHIESFIFDHIIEIDNKSHKILDEFKIFDTISSLNYQTYTECIALFDMDNSDSFDIYYQDIRTYKFKNILIIPVQKQNKKYILDRICSSLDNVNLKALYYASNNENILLHSANAAFYGTKFLDEINNVVHYIRKNFQSIISNELLILPKKDFDGRELQTEKFVFDYVEKISYTDQRTIYKYYFKENVKMNVTNMYVFGNMYNIEQISGDLNMVNENCENPEVKKYIQEAKEAIEKKDESKLKKCLNWLGEHAIELIKDVGAGVLVELITKGANL